MISAQPGQSTGAGLFPLSLSLFPTQVGQQAAASIAAAVSWPAWLFVVAVIIAAAANLHERVPGTAAGLLQLPHWLEDSCSQPNQAGLRLSFLPRDNSQPRQARGSSQPVPRFPVVVFFKPSPCCSCGVTSLLPFLNRTRLKSKPNFRKDPKRDPKEYLDYRDSTNCYQSQNSQVHILP